VLAPSAPHLRVMHLAIDARWLLSHGCGVGEVLLRLGFPTAEAASRRFYNHGEIDLVPVFEEFHAPHKSQPRPNRARTPVRVRDVCRAA